MIVWLICGGRAFAGRAEAIVFNHIMSTIVAERGPPDLVVHGGARGADTLAGMWAKARGIEVREVRAEWDLYGNSAGPIRNAKMLKDFTPVLCIAFPGGDGTADMMRKCRKAGVEVIEPV